MGLLGILVTASMIVALLFFGAIAVTYGMRRDHDKERARGREADPRE